MKDDLISRQAAIDANGEQWVLAVDANNNAPSAQSETCKGCKYFDKLENEVLPFPCTCCKRKAVDYYEK